MAEPRRVRHVLSPTGVQPKREWGLQTIAADPTHSRSVGRACSQLKFPTTQHQVLLTTALFQRAPGYRGHFLSFWPKEGSVLVDD